MNVLTSEERREVRYLRRKQKRDAKKKYKLYQHDKFEYVFSYSHMMAAGRKCLNGVLWKGSVQRFALSMSATVITLLNKLSKGTYKFKGFYTFDIFERGKLRHIKSVDIKERCVQKTLCDYCLIPTVERRLIDDNAASRKGKGYHYTIRRLREH